MSTEELYHKLVSARKACRLCPRLQNPATISGGELDSDEIGPYARWQGRLDAAVLVVAQDFADVQTFLKLGGWPGEKNRTNLVLTELLTDAGVPTRPPKVGVADDAAFFTNAVLCMKSGGMSAAVPARYYQTCGRQFLKPLIELIRPRAVVTLGVGALKAVRAGFDVPKLPLRELVERCPSAFLGPETALFAMYHPSRTVLISVRSLALPREDWRRLGRWWDAA